MIELLQTLAAPTDKFAGVRHASNTCLILPRGRTRFGAMSDSTDTVLTERQRTILDVIRNSVSSRGYPPSIREIGDAVGLTSTSSVAHQLRLSLIHI